MKNINISEILKDKPQGTKLYSPMFGECFLDHIVKSNGEIWVRHNNTLHVFDRHGKPYSDGECLLFPSKEMRDWEKFSKPKFKDGDIVYIETKENYKIISIFKEFLTGKRPVDYAKLFLDESRVRITGKCSFICEWHNIIEIRLATDSEKQQLLDALAKAGKRWNPETKTLEDLPKKHVFKPFERVLVRDYDDEEWCASFFSHYADKEKTQTITVNDYGSQQCIPYEGNEHLLGTTNSPM